MKNTQFILGLLASLVICIAIITPASAYSLLFFNPSVVESNPGETPAVDLMMEGFDSGISGYSLYLTLDNPSVASFGEILFPAWVSMNRVVTINSSTVLIQGADLGNQVEPGIPSEKLATISIHANTAGYATLHVDPVMIDDDRHGRYDLVSKTASIVISGAGPSPVIPASQ
ncbi:hypothetical protein ACKUB1_01215 [Methanospirillum stamsii]|uniref:Cohesin domain-containing protein n=1 Tax=Methanospirillum stamsii TaxID=1277351 RepID=A0A2V2N386_9EURY|nr:hypothetical protein [Methanospirillum stamsii]PWR74612.1 hypothetical protein DLD82_08505 [Methanospirillum stamsii]